MTTTLDITNHATAEKAAPGICCRILTLRFVFSSLPIGNPNPPGNITYNIRRNP